MEENGDVARELARWFTQMSPLLVGACYAMFFESNPSMWSMPVIVGLGVSVVWMAMSNRAAIRADLHMRRRKASDALGGRRLD